jgi:hypothetical protein
MGVRKSYLVWSRLLLDELHLELMEEFEMLPQDEKYALVWAYANRGGAKQLVHRLLRQIKERR